MRRDHLSEVAALAVVVRATFDALKDRGLPTPALEALALVEAWVAGEAVASATLLATALLAHEDGVPYAQRTKDRLATWARTAAGNLALMARKERGWQAANAAVISAIECTLGSAGLDPHGVAASYRKALAGAPRSPKSRTPERKARSTRFTEHIGAAANRRLARRRPSFDEALRGTETQLRALLAQRGYPVHGAVLRFDARYGGLVAADEPSDEAEDWLFGAHACLQSGAHRDPRGDRPSWVPVAYSPNDCIFYLDDEGVAWVVDTIEDLTGSRYADSGDAMMMRIFTED